MQDKLFINGTKLNLTAADLIQTGGEGMVFAYGTDQAIKIYHDIQETHRQKLQYIIDQTAARQGLSQQLPDGVYAPQELVVDEQGEIIGFAMNRMSSTMRPFKKLSLTNYCKQHQITLPQVVNYLQQIHQTLTQLHQLGFVVGDLNDHNLFFTLDENTTPQIGWIDVDSYQIGPHPCPVALQPFLDPQLYDITDFSQKPVFSEESDWYAFFVLLVKSLLHVHPYGGVHHVHKSLIARAENKVSILNGAITYPKQARPVEVLSDALLQHVQAVFSRGERPLFPAKLLNDYAQSLLECPHCGQYYPHERSMCPQCRQKTTLQAPIARHGQLRFRLLLETNGYIEQLWIKPDNNFGSHNRFHVIVREGTLYTLIYSGIGGIIEEMPLFAGEPGYRFGYFDQHLVVNPPNRPHLLILDVSGVEPTRLAMLETDLYEGQASFATTPAHLYRLANGYIMQSSIVDGQLVEEMVGTAHQHQTNLWGSRHNDTLVGVQRIFGDYQLFIRRPSGHTQDFSLPLYAGESIKEMDVAFNLNGRDVSLFAQTILAGQIQYNRIYTEINTLLTAEAQPFVHAPATLHDSVLTATNDGILKQKGHVQMLLHDAADYITAGDMLHAHPRGLIIQQAQRLYLVES